MGIYKQMFQKTWGKQVHDFIDANTLGVLQVGRELLRSNGKTWNTKEQKAQIEHQQRNNNIQTYESDQTAAWEPNINNVISTDRAVRPGYKRGKAMLNDLGNINASTDNLAEVGQNAAFPRNASMDNLAKVGQQVASVPSAPIPKAKGGK